MANLIHLQKSLNIDEAKAIEYVSRLKCMQIKKGEHFQLQGDTAKYMGYVDLGKFKYYKIDKEGNEHSLWFNKSFPFIGDYHSFLKKTSAELNVQALDNYEIVLFNYEQLMELFESYNYLITGYTDALGSADYNLTLSRARAKAVVSALVKRGVPSGILKSVGVGKKISHMPTNAPENIREGDRKVTIEVVTNAGYWNNLPAN